MSAAEDTKAPEVPEAVADATTTAAAAADEALPPPLVRVPTTQKAMGAMGEEMKSLWSKCQEFMGEEAIKTATEAAAFSATSEEDFKAKVAELQKQARDSMRETLKSDGTLVAMFKKYDANEDGVLSKDEVLELIRDYLGANAEWAPELVKSTVKVSITVTENALMGTVEGDEPTPEEAEAMAEAMALQKQMMDAMIEPMIRAAETVAKAMLEDVEQFAADFFVALDKDMNGTVDKDEFLDGFVDEMSAVFAPERTLKYQLMAMGEMMTGLMDAVGTVVGDVDDEDDCCIM